MSEKLIVGIGVANLLAIDGAAVCAQQRQQSGRFLPLSLPQLLLQPEELPHRLPLHLVSNVL